jgi:excinuclease UvrABC ATPase subunit
VIRLVDDGNIVTVIEHSLDVIRSAAWIIDLGPEGGSKGGEIAFEATLVEPVKAKRSLTGQYLQYPRRGPNKHLAPIFSGSISV